MNNFKVEVIADSSGEWCSNGCRYATEEEAKSAGSRLAWRWTAVREWRVVPSEDAVNQNIPAAAAQSAAEVAQ
jgi:hypothetical protein